MPGERALHICLAGPGVCNNWRLIQRLKERHQITLLERLEVPAGNTILRTADVLALDCSLDGAQSIEILLALRKGSPGLCVVILDGGLSQRDIATAFREGAQDYFSDPYDVELIAERLEFLGLQGRRP